MTPTLLLATYLAVVFIAAATAKAADPPKGSVIASLITQTRVCQDHIGQARSRAGNPWAKHSTGYRVWQKNLWTNRLNHCKQILERRKYEWNWQAWLPDKWQRIGQCETGLNWRHHNSSYQGAFGFATSSWDAFKLPGYPADADQASPWQQYQVALAIYRRYGLSGWGCRNA